VSTVLELMTASLRKIGSLAVGEVMSSEEAADALAELNRMLSSWSTEGLMVPTRVREEFTLTPGTAVYTMGSSGTFNTTRPVTFKDASATLEIQTSSPTIEVPLRIVGVDEWAAVMAKDIQTEIPLYLYPEGTYPLETLNLFPVPNYAHKLVLYTAKELTAFAAITDTVSLQPGYEDALIYNLAIRLAPEYGRPLDEVTVSLADTAKARIKRINHRPQFLRVDPALVPHGGRFNVFTGEYNR